MWLLVVHTQLQDGGMFGIYNCTWYLVARQLDDHNIACLFHNTAFFKCNKEVKDKGGSER